MATLFESILDEVKTKSSDICTQVKMICDKIKEEENPEPVVMFVNKEGENQGIDITPTGPNIFLALPVPGLTTRDITFLCLERELKESFIISIWTKPDYMIGPLRRVVTHQIPDGELPKNILKEYALKFKVMKGE